MVEFHFDFFLLASLVVEERAQLICQQTFKYYPERTFFQLLLRWVRQKKYQFIKDALNTLIVLNSHFPGKQLSAFLLESQDFCISPLSARCPKLKVSYVGVGDKSIAQKTNSKILLTYCTVVCWPHILFSYLVFEWTPYGTNKYSLY